MYQALSGIDRLMRNNITMLCFQLPHGIWERDEILSTDIDGNFMLTS